MNSPLLPDTLNGWLDLVESRHPVSVDLGLERCGEVWRRMGKPQPANRIFVVAGTNGKGSTVATLCSLLSALGYSHGSYTSPHITHFNERICLDGAPVSDEVIIEAFARVEAARAEVSLSYFEFSTLAAFSVLALAGLDFAVMEIGLGGRLDAVNLLDSDCAVITPIGLDHQDYLGDDLWAIGREKAGIIRAGRPVICGEPNPPGSIINRAAELSAPLKCLGRDFNISRFDGKAVFEIDGRQINVPVPVLSGPHQLGNMATALAALFEILPEAVSDAGALLRGLGAVSLQGRFERISRRPAIWMDVGHNAMAARAVAATLLEAMETEGLVKCRCVIAMLADKDAEAVAAELGSAVSAWYCASLDVERGQSGAELATRLAEAGGEQDIRVFETVPNALEAAVSDSGPADAVLVFGSFYTAAEVLGQQ